MNIKLPETKSKLYAGNPLKLKNGEIRKVEHSKEIDLLLNEGAIEPTNELISEEKDESNKMLVDEKKEETATIKRPTVARTTRNTEPIEVKKKGFRRK